MLRSAFGIIILASFIDSQNTYIDATHGHLMLLLPVAPFRRLWRCTVALGGRVVAQNGVRMCPVMAIKELCIFHRSPSKKAE